MQHYRLNVMISLDSAYKQYRLADMLPASESGDTFGPQKVEVALYKGNDVPATVSEATEVIVGLKDGKLPKNDLYFILTGDAILADVEDVEDTSEIDEQLAKDIGEVGKADDRNDCDLLYALNHDGLPLLYNGAIRDTFAKEKVGRKSVQQATDNALEASMWLATSDPKLFAELCAKSDKAGIMAAYQNRSK